MTVDLDAILVALAQVAPVVALLARESARWRAELASWRDQLSGARIIIEPARPLREPPAGRTLTDSATVDGHVPMDEPTDEERPVLGPVPPRADHVTRVPAWASPSLDRPARRAGRAP